MTKRETGRPSLEVLTLDGAHQVLVVMPLVSRKGSCAWDPAVPTTEEDKSAMKMKMKTKTKMKMKNEKEERREKMLTGS